MEDQIGQEPGGQRATLVLLVQQSPQQNGRRGFKTKIERIENDVTCVSVSQCDRNATFSLS